MKKYVMTGLVMLLPLALTFWIITAIIRWLTGPFIGIAEAILSTIGLQGTPILFMSADNVRLHLSQLLILVSLSILIMITGAIGQRFFFRYFMRLSDAALNKIPIISSVYKTSQELIQTILATDNQAFKQVVLVPFPNTECWSVGLVTKEDPATPHLIPVFVPTTPNPTSGYLILYDRSKVIPIQMSVEEAFRYIVSCGVLVSKDSFKLALPIPKESAS